MTERDRFLAARDFLRRHRADPAAAADFSWPVLERFNWATDYFDQIARDNDAPALHLVEEDGRETWMSYAELSDRSSRVARFLEDLGASPGDRVLLMLGNEAPLWEAMLAAIKLGLVVIPATTMLSADDLADRLARGRVRHIVTNAAGAAGLDRLPASAVTGINRILAAGPDAPVPTGWIDYRTAADAPADFTPAALGIDEPLLEYFTSGTTARPKLVRHTRASYPVGHLSTMYWLGLERGDVHWTISSPGWAKHAWSCFFAPFNAEACVFIYNYSRFHGPTVLDVLVRHGVRTLCAPPTVWRMLIQEELGRWPVALRELISAGEPLNPEVIEQVRAAWGLAIRDGYGQTETTAQVGNPPGAALRPGSMGRPMPGYDVVLLDHDGRPAEEGEICLALDPRPMGLMTGYADDAGRTADVMRDGHYHTGDVARRDGDGYLTYVGRTDDVFKSSGYRISPFELESVLIEHPAVVEAAVVPSPDPLRGFVPKAFIVPAAGHDAGADTAASIFRFLRERLAGYQMIRRLEFAELPKTISGKIRRVELRGLETARPAEGRRSEREFREEDGR
ncbi:MAG: AMP-binding protein [Gemmatimonadales bacterium]